MGKYKKVLIKIAILVSAHKHEDNECGRLCRKINYIIQKLPHTDAAKHRLTIKNNEERRIIYAGKNSY